MSYVENLEVRDYVYLLECKARLIKAEQAIQSMSDIISTFKGIPVKENN